MTGLEDHDIVFVRYEKSAKDRHCLPYFIAVDKSTHSIGECPPMLLFKSPRTHIDFNQNHLKSILFCMYLRSSMYLVDSIWHPSYPSSEKQHDMKIYVCIEKHTCYSWEESSLACVYTLVRCLSSSWWDFNNFVILLSLKRCYETWIYGTNRSVSHTIWAS